MHFPLSTGQVGDLFDVPEPRINDLIRRKKFRPIPEVIAGRRAWLREHLAALASFLGITLPRCADTGSESAR